MDMREKMQITVYIVRCKLSEIRIYSIGIEHMLPKQNIQLLSSVMQAQLNMLYPIDTATQFFKKKGESSKIPAV